MAFFDPALFLIGQLAEHLSQMLAQALVQHLPASLGDENNVACTPISSGLSFHIRPSRFSSMCAWRLTSWSFLDGLPKMSNCYCLPGRAGGSPGWTSQWASQLRPASSRLSIHSPTIVVPAFERS